MEETGKRSRSNIEKIIRLKEKERYCIPETRIGSLEKETQILKEVFEIKKI